MITQNLSRRSDSQLAEFTLLVICGERGAETSKLEIVSPIDLMRQMSRRIDDQCHISGNCWFEDTPRHADDIFESGGRLFANRTHEMRRSKREQDLVFDLLPDGNCVLL
jgi:hypothetical protein